MENLDSKLLIFQFANITSKQDSANLISILNKEISKCNHDFCYGRLVTIKNEVTEKTKVGSFIMTTSICGILYLSWKEKNDLNINESMLQNIDDISNGIIEDNTYLIWDVIPGFNLYVTSDLAFYAI